MGLFLLINNLETGCTNHLFCDNSFENTKLNIEDKKLINESINSVDYIKIHCHLLVCICMSSNSSVDNLNGTTPSGRRRSVNLDVSNFRKYWNYVRTMVKEADISDDDGKEAKLEAALIKQLSVHGIRSKNTIGINLKVNSSST